jgi:hypothetical protein
MTDAEAATIEKYEVQRNQKDLEPSDPNRKAPVGATGRPPSPTSKGCSARVAA